MAIQEKIIRLKCLDHSQRKVTKILGIHRIAQNVTTLIPDSQAPDWVIALN